MNPWLIGVLLAIFALVFCFVGWQWGIIILVSAMAGIVGLNCSDDWMGGLLGVGIGTFCLLSFGLLIFQHLDFIKHFINPGV